MPSQSPQRYFQNNSMVSLKKTFWLLSFSLPLIASAQSTVVVSAPELNVPVTIGEWRNQRKSIRETLVKVMGDLPPRQKITAVRVLSREDKGSYEVEKFEFDNGAGSIVPGYFLIPKNGRAKHPAIFYCHWHGGNYDLGKQEIFTTH